MKAAAVSALSSTQSKMPTWPRLITLTPLLPASAIPPHARVEAVAALAGAEDLGFDLGRRERLELLEELGLGQLRVFAQLRRDRQDQAEFGRLAAEMGTEDVRLDAAVMSDDDLLRGIDVKPIAEAAAAGEGGQRPADSDARRGRDQYP